MDAIAISEAQDPNFWQGTPSSDHEWHLGRHHNNSLSDAEEDEEYDEDPLHSWDHHGSLTRDDDSAYPDFNSYGYGDPLGYNAVDWSSDAQDQENRTPGAAPPQRRGQKRKSESDGFDPSSSPSRSMAGSPGSKAGRSGSGSGTGSLFFKTKLCIKFRAGTCPYNSNCNFAHGMEELRKPPPGWEELVAAQEGGNGSSGGGGSGSASTSRNTIKENAAGQLVLSSSDSQRFRRTRRCKKYYSEEGCPYGDRCNFLHDDQAKARESNAISLGPSTSGSGSGGGSGGNAAGSGSVERPSNWKTRMCNKWEMTGHCPFGQKCNFAHGLTELQTYTGSAVDSDNAATPSTGLQSDGKQPIKSTAKLDVSASTTYVSDVHNPLRHRSAFPSSSKTQKQVKLLENWKGPGDVISTIYGDWIEEDE